jgi:hypothetical protein
MTPVPNTLSYICLDTDVYTIQKNFGVLHYAWYELFIVRENHHLNKQVLQVWKALNQVNDQVHFIRHDQKQGLDRLPHCS